MKKTIKKSYENWRESHLKPATTKVPLRKDQFVTSSGIEHPDCYVPESNDDYLEKLGFPGQYPFTRGVQPSMYRSRHWTMRQYAGFATAAETNKRYHYLLASGTTGLSVAFDLPTQMGRDSDDPLVKGEVGRVGVAIDSIHDMRTLFDGIPLESVSTSMTINATAHILLALYLVCAEEKKVPWDRLQGTIQNDILKEYIARGTYIYPPEPSLKIVTDVFEFCKTEVPRWNTISVSGYHIREAGSTAVQEVAFTLANGIAYLDAAVARGLAIDEFAPRVAFFFNCHNDFLEEVAKFRAARRMWARIVRERFGAKNDKSCMLRFHTQTAGSTLTAQQPMTNVVRTSLQALAAVLGGTQSLHTNSYDEALCLPTQSSALLALRTQQVIACESGVADVVDPLAGSYAIEALTDEIETQALAYIERIDALGGMTQAIEQEFPQKEIEEAAFRYQQALEQNEQLVVGLNAYKETAGNNPTTAQSISPDQERQQIEQLTALRSSRDEKAAVKCLAALGEQAKSGNNIMPHVVAAVRAEVTLGEVANCLRDIFGEHRGG